MEPEQVLPLWVRVDLGVMAMKAYSTLPIFPELEPHYQVQFSVITRTFLWWAGGLAPTLQEMQSAYSKPHPQGITKREINLPDILLGGCIYAKPEKEKKKYSHKKYFNYIEYLDNFL